MVRVEYSWETLPGQYGGTGHVFVEQDGDYWVDYAGHTLWNVLYYALRRELVKRYGKYIEVEKPSSLMEDDGMIGEVRYEENDTFFVYLLTYDDTPLKSPIDDEVE